MANSSLFMVFFGMLVSICIAGTAIGQEITPAMEQELMDAKAAVTMAQNAQSDKYAADIMKKVRELLTAAENARPRKEGALFSQSSRLARAHAELAKAVTELKIEEEKLAIAHNDVKTTRAEIERLKKVQ
jgi:hypothetical protein